MFKSLPSHLISSTSSGENSYILLTAGRYDIKFGMGMFFGGRKPMVMSEFQNFIILTPCDTIFGFLTPKNLPMHIFQSKQSFYHGLLCLN